MSSRGRLKVYLGYAAGVGKTYRMLQEAQALRQQGADIVIGYFEPHGRRETIAKTEGLETIPRRTVVYGGAQFEEMDTDAILRRKPRIAVVDEFAHTNVPGSERLKRWQDVQALLDAGIDVLTTMNIQHLESLNDQVYQVTGIRVRETIPDWVVDEADELVFVDLTPRALHNRLERGVIYAPEKAQRAMDNFFTESNLTALREMAMRHAAHEVEEKLSIVPGVGESPASAPEGHGAPRRTERILICLTGRPSSAILIRRGKRVADYLHADCLAIHVTQAHSSFGDDREAVERHMSFARNLRIDTHVVEAADVPLAITDFAREQSVTQIFMGRSAAQPWWKRYQETVVQGMVRLARDMQVTIVAERRR
jgi:two-component system sensor histidine kinase KdpD